MAGGGRVHGIVAAVLTPFDERLQPDAPKAAAYYRELLECGCDGLNVLGTTGEAVSLSVQQRSAYMEALGAAGLPLDRMIVGTGASALADAIALTRHAVRTGFAAALVMPPFYYRDIPDDGVIAFFGMLFDAASPPQGSVLLYNFPRMSGVTFTSDLVGRLCERFPGIIAGVKDSSNDAALQRALHEAHPDLAIFPGSEADLCAARERGMAGCISGSVALWPQAAARAWHDGDARAAEEIARKRAELGSPLIGHVRAAVARARADESWLRSIAPL